MKRLTIRLSPAYERWVAQMGAEQSDAARALMVLGAAALGLPGASREAMRLLESDFAADVEDALARLADTRQTHGRHTADTTPAALIEPLEMDDPFVVGIEV